MRPLRNRLEEARQRLGAPWEVLERDYVLSWILAGIDRVPALGYKYAPVAITCERYVERDPHPRGQEAFAI